MDHFEFINNIWRHIEITREAEKNRQAAWERAGAVALSPEPIREVSIPLALKAVSGVPSALYRSRANWELEAAEPVWEVAARMIFPSAWMAAALATSTLVPVAVVTIPPVSKPPRAVRFDLFQQDPTLARSQRRQ